MLLLTLLLIVTLVVIAAILVIISIKLTDLVAEAKACRLAVQNIEADDLFQQGHFSESQRKALQQHQTDLLTLIERIEIQLNPNFKSEHTPHYPFAKDPKTISSPTGQVGHSRV
jgi:type II secretory pathway pseudopilin PulG